MSQPFANQPAAGGLLIRFLHERPFISLFLLVALSNVAGSVFNILYNRQLIVERFLDEDQRWVFFNIAVPAYNLLAYPAGLTVTLILLWPLIRCRRMLREGDEVPPEFLEYCRRRVVNLPFLQLFVNFLGWMPGAVFFPLVICGLGGWTDKWVPIWGQFFVSFTVSAVFTTSQTFFILEWFLMKVLYPLFFQDSRPADVKGRVPISFGKRLMLLWAAVAVMPLVSVTVVVLNFDSQRHDYHKLAVIACVVAALGTVSGWLIFRLVGWDLERWLDQHKAATEQIGHGNFEVRIPEKRPDEWGKLTDRFNDMATDLARARRMHETFGQFVSPRVRDEIMEHYQGVESLEVTKREITVLFADIRGFTRRCAGESPERVGRLLNRFLTLALRAIEERGGYVNKFLGDGVMALFNAPLPQDDHADLAVACAHAMVDGLHQLNLELERDGQAPLAIGVGIHTGPALVGCYGATVIQNGKEGMRREYSAIGATVNYSQRLEQMTKELGGPVLMSETTRASLKQPIDAETLGPQPLPGCQESLVVHRIVVRIK